MIGLWGEMGHPWRYILSYGKYFKWIVSSLMTAGTPTLHQHTRFAGNIKPTELQSSTFYFLSHFILKFTFSPPLMMVIGNNTMAPPVQLQPSVGWIDGTFRQTWPVTLLGSVSCNHLLCASVYLTKQWLLSLMIRLSVSVVRALCIHEQSSHNRNRELQYVTPYVWITSYHYYSNTRLSWQWKGDSHTTVFPKKKTSFFSVGKKNAALAMRIQNCDRKIHF